MSTFRLYYLLGVGAAGTLAMGVTPWVLGTTYGANTRLAHTATHADAGHAPGAPDGVQALAVASSSSA